ncbi:hypothetical protein BVRB_2g039140 [Beta vulgaris subsp. vulgaris]|nr:hypothetical protein BVRB_2g039140 [Beta vulgaris subsp. vulgaris]
MATAALSASFLIKKHPQLQLLVLISLSWVKGQSLHKVCVVKCSPSAFLFSLC